MGYLVLIIGVVMVMLFSLGYLGLIVGVVIAMLLGLAHLMEIWEKRTSEKRSLILLEKATYIGGHPDIRPDDGICLMLHKDRLELINTDSNTNNTITLDFDDILDCSVKTETELSESVSMPSVLLLGAFALLAKKQNKQNTYFFTLKFKQDENIHEILLSSIISHSRIPELSKKIKQMKWDLEHQAV